MGFGGGRGGPPRGRGGFGGRGGFRGGRGGGGHQMDYGPPESVIELGKYVHPCEDDLVLKATVDGVPYFNAGVFLENKQQIGKVDDIFGPVNDFYCSVKLIEEVKASSFKPDQTFFVDPMKLLPLQRFTNPQKPGPRGGRGGRGGPGGRGRGGPRGGPRGGRGGFGDRGGRGGFGDRGGRGGFGGGRGGFGRGGAPGGRQSFGGFSGGRGGYDGAKRGRFE